MRHKRHSGRGDGGGGAIINFSNIKKPFETAPSSDSPLSRVMAKSILCRLSVDKLHYRRPNHPVNREYIYICIHKYTVDTYEFILTKETLLFSLWSLESRCHYFRIFDLILVADGFYNLFICILTIN